MKLGGLTLGKAPVVCGVIVKSIDFTSVNKALKTGADLVEVRLDTFSARGIKEIKGPLKRLSARGVPLVLTVRSAKEGGRCKLTDADRLALFKELTSFVDAIDIELSSKRILKQVIEAAHGERKKVIVSYHNFKTTPKTEKLEKIIKEARNSGADIIKIAAFASDKADLRRLAGLLTDNKDLIVIAMGRGGSASRVFFPMLGSLITYAGITGLNAPGQLSLAALKREFKSFGY